jgi:hypothetical protein
VVDPVYGEPPRRPRSAASASPIGPPPTINTGVSMTQPRWFMLRLPLVLEHDQGSMNQRTIAAEDLKSFTAVVSNGRVCR